MTVLELVRTLLEMIDNYKLNPSKTEVCFSEDDCYNHFVHNISGIKMDYSVNIQLKNKIILVGSK